MHGRTRAARRLEDGHGSVAQIAERLGEVREIGGRRGNIAQLLEMDKRESFLPEDVRKDCGYEMIRAAAARAGYVPVGLVFTPGLLGVRE
jgi:hypothetical protein